MTIPQVLSRSSILSIMATYACLSRRRGTENRCHVTGSFMQRGEPAICGQVDTGSDGAGKWSRLGSRIALLVSIPGMADFSRSRSCGYLGSLEHWYLAFWDRGSSGLSKISDSYTEQGAKMEKFVENLSDSLSYPQKPKPCLGRNLEVLIFQAIPPIMFSALAYAKAVAGRNIA